MTRHTQIFRIRYIGQSGTIREIEIGALDTSEAIHAAREARWPPKAVAFRLIDTLGREVFEQQKADLR
jgi:hypothetical protein